jgi:hypothetical protein
MYPVYQFRIYDGRTFKILPVPAVDLRHAEMRAKEWCAGTPWRIVERISSNRPKFANRRPTLPANAGRRLNQRLSRES